MNINLSIINFYLVVNRKRVSTIIPNGPEAAVALISVLTRWCAAPINPSITKDEIRSELLSTKAKAIIILADAAVNTTAIQAAEEIGLGVLVATPSKETTGLFSISAIRRIPQSYHSNDAPSVATTIPGFVHYDHPRTVLVLHTSGTSGRKKLVPYSLDMVINGVGCIISSWNLKPNDVCLNLMPLFHVGGIIRNILSPILSGGSVIACSSFDPVLFWDLMYNGQRVSWYYAAPTMHHALLMEAANRPKPLPINNIRFIANAAGGLLPGKVVLHVLLIIEFLFPETYIWNIFINKVLAEELRSTFNATILTSYGMTECMPISSPPQTYRLDPSGTSGMCLTVLLIKCDDNTDNLSLLNSVNQNASIGIPVGPDVIIANLNDYPAKRLGPGIAGNILVRGSPCFGGYENDNATNEESFYFVDGKEGWFNTGDIGHLDASNYLYISGRSKEVINRGGETISPFEIEEAIILHPLVKETLAFSAPHEKYQETVGVLIVPYADKPRPDLVNIQKYLKDRLHWSKVPQVIIYMDALPKNANGKTLRINIAERTGLGNVDEESSQLTRLFEAKCPEINTPLSTAIPISSVDFESSVQQLLLSADSRVTKVIIVTVDLPGKQDTVAAFVELPGIENEATSERNTLASRMKKLCEEQLHQYCTPKLVHVMKPSVTSLPTLRQRAFQLLNAIDAVSLPQNQLEKDVEIIWRDFFSLTTTISTDLSFFELGGDSLKAGQLMTKMRKTFQVDLNVSDLLSAPTIEAMASKIDGLKRVPSTRKSIVLDLLGMDVVNQDLDCKYKSADCVSPFSSSSLPCMFVQSLPLVLFGPSLYITKWFLWAFYWTLMERINVCGDRLLSLILACVMMRITVAIVAPFVAIVLKWIIIGRFKPGRYQLWGAMYLRWWIVSQISMICGKGIFSMDPRLLCLYYRMLGASIGSNVKIHGDAKLGEWDLIHIGDDVCIDAAIVRPFTLDEGHFIQLPIKIGSYCSVGAKSVVIPGTVRFFVWLF